VPATVLAFLGREGDFVARVDTTETTLIGLTRDLDRTDEGFETEAIEEVGDGRFRVTEALG
jgi:hypothetical protein